MPVISDTAERRSLTGRAIERYASLSGKGADLAIRLRLLFAMVLANIAGIAVVALISFLVLPLPRIEDELRIALINTVAGGAYAVGAIVVGFFWASRGLRPGRRWLVEERAPTEREQRLILRSPLYLVRVQSVSWALAAIAFGVLNYTFDPELGQRIAVTVMIAGLATGAVAYLLTERMLRPLAARALAARPLAKPAVPGVLGRTFLTWALGTALPVIGLMTAALSALIEKDFTRSELAILVLALGGVLLASGLLISILNSRAVSDPLRTLRRAFGNIEEGDLETEVTVYDGSEIGLLQASFNEMAEGLREREKIRDLFGRHVGEEVARAAEEGEVEMGGETLEVAILFIDMTGSTTIAAERPATEVVDLLNRYFAIVVEVVAEHEGWINKFEGDAALAVFGAPNPVADAAGCALRAARALSARLGEELPDVESGIGVSHGSVVAGNIGEPRRYEYTVIGDPVNQAARLSELAKQKPGGVLASGRAIEAASEQAADEWELGESVQLRGRTSETVLALPRSTTERTGMA